MRPVSSICEWIPFTYVQLLLCLTFEIKATFDLRSGIVLYKNTGNLSRESVMNYNCHKIITKCKVFHSTDLTDMHNIHCINQFVESVYKAMTMQIGNRVILILNWWKGKPSGSIACTRKQQPRFYWSCSSVLMNDATPLTPPSAWAELHFQM